MLEREQSGGVRARWDEPGRGSRSGLNAPSVAHTRGSKCSAMPSEVSSAEQVECRRSRRAGLVQRLDVVLGHRRGHRVRLG